MTHENIAVPKRQVLVTVVSDIVSVSILSKILIIFWAINPHEIKTEAVAPLLRHHDQKLITTLFRRYLKKVSNGSSSMAIREILHAKQLQLSMNTSQMMMPD